MAVFSITGDIDPFLHVSLKRGETLYCESDAMVTMDATLELKGKMKGGLAGALMRSFANGESFVPQHIEATRGDGECLLAPTLPGSLAIIDCGAQQYKLGDGAFVAASSGVDLRVRTQSLGNALFAQSGGFFITETSGSGQVAIAGFGAMRVLDVTPDKEIIIDNAHVVCWDASLRHDITVGTSRGGLLGGLVNSQFSGEGMVIRFSGRGKVYVCSRNRVAFQRFLLPAQGQ